MHRLLAVSGGGSGFAVRTITVADVMGAVPVKQGAVLDHGSSGAFDAYLVESPVVWWDPTAGKWGMVYTGYDAGPTRSRVGLAWSDDLVTWTKDGASPIFSHSGSGFDANGITAPYIRLEGGTYYLFYCGLTATGYEGGTPSLGVATASSIYGPWTRHGQIIAPSGSGWRSQAIYHPSIVKSGATYYLFFNSKGPTTSEQIGYAMSSDLLTWTVDDVNSPLLSPTSGFESFVIGDPSVIECSDGWAMAYYGATASYANPSDAWASTDFGSFPLGWTRYGSNPVLTPTPATFDSGGAGKPFILISNGVLYHFYTGDTTSLSSNRKIGLATSTL